MSRHETGAPAGYRIVLPPGWAQIPLRERTDEALDDVLFRHLAEVPADVPKDDAMRFRLALRRRVEGAVREARRRGGLELYMPVRPRGGMLIAASFIMSAIRSGTAGEASAPTDAVLARLAGDSGEGTATRAVEFDGSPAVRREYRSAPADGGAAESDGLPARHVAYVLPVPGGTGHWLATTFSTPGDGDLDSPFTDALVELFDATMTTFRWRCG